MLNRCQGAKYANKKKKVVNSASEIPVLMPSNPSIAKDPIAVGMKNRKTPVSNGSFQAAKNTTKLLPIISVTLAVLYFFILISHNDNRGEINKII
jgi:hypothetical protein